MNERSLPRWLETIIFIILIVALTLAGIGNIYLEPEFDKARQKDPWLIVID